MWKNRPEVEDTAMRYYEAFQFLTHGRPIGFGGPLPIPLVEMDAYIRLYEVPQYERVAFIRLMRVIDLGYLDLFEKAKPKQPAR